MEIKDGKVIINGVEITLTDEQIKLLNPFVRVKESETYYYISAQDDICSLDDDYDDYDTASYAVANYFNSREVAEQVMLHQQLYRRLLKFGHEHNCIANPNEEEVYYIFKDGFGGFAINSDYDTRGQGTVYFTNREIAEKAIHKIIFPFIAENPNFIW